MHNHFIHINCVENNVSTFIRRSSDRIFHQMEENIMNDESLVIKILEETNPDTLDLLCYFNKRDAQNNLRKVFLGELSKHPKQIEPLIELGLIEVFSPSKSVLYYKDKLDDIIFTPEIPGYDKELIEESKEIFKGIIRFSTKVPANRRICDDDGKVHSFFVELLQRLFNDLKKEKTPVGKNEMIYFKLLKDFNIIKEYGPAKSYRITPIGEHIRQEIIKKKSQEKLPEELELEDLLQRLNMFVVENDPN